jgi:CheY-like chemotaxis protein
VRLSGAILLAEDGPDNQVLISTLLRRAGAAVTIVENGRLAVDRALAAERDGQPFGVILMDMQMPELDGYGAAAMLRSKGYRRSIVALTAHAMASDRERCLAAGCSDYLTKPIQRDTLLRVVSGHLEAAVREAPALAAARNGSAEPAWSDFADDDEMGELIRQFVDTLSDRAHALRDAAARGDLAGLERLAHQLKGAAGGYGFSSITSAAAEVEAAVRRQMPPERIREALDGLVRRLAGARTGRRDPA